MVIDLQRGSNISTEQSPGSDPAALTQAGHAVAAVALGCILVSGFLGNLLVLLVFSRFPGLRTPVSLLLINISVSDMLVCLFGTPLSFAASVRGRWLTGPHGCRCYGPEGPGTICSVQWQQRSGSARSYVICLFIFCLLLPLLLMFFCYGRILLAVRGVETRGSRTNQSPAEWREGRVLLMVTAMVTSYLLCWMPYGVVAIFASFGRPGMVSPAATLVPSLLAKTSTALNPIIYVLLNDQFSRCFYYMTRCGSEPPPFPVQPSSTRCEWPPFLPTEEQNLPQDALTPRNEAHREP
ncbi:pinopsin isoform X3 [Oryzias latipes]